MNRYLLDTNHRSALQAEHSVLESRIQSEIVRGSRFGVCLPVLCEYQSGLRRGSRVKRNLTKLRQSMKFLRVWPADLDTSIEFGKLSEDLRAAGRVLSAFDHLIAAIARQHDLTLLTADGDFTMVPALHVENWLV